MEYLAIRIIDTMPGTVRRLTADLTDAQLRFRPAEGEWSVVEMIGHLVDKTEAWGERFRRIASEEQPVLPGFDQDTYVLERGYQTQEVAALTSRLDAALRAVADHLRSVPDGAWSRAGLHAERGRLTLGEAVRIYAASLSEHVAQFVATRNAALRPQDR